MAKIFGDLSYDTPRPMYVGQPIEEIKALQQESDKSFQQNAAMKDQLDVMASNLKLDDVDYAYKKAAIDNMKQTFKDVVDSGRYELAGSVVRKAAKDFATDKGLNGALQSYQNQVAYQKQVNDLYDKKDKNGNPTISDEQRKVYLGASKKAYKGVTIDPTTGEATGLFQGLNPVDFQDIPAKTMALAKDFVASSYGSKYSNVHLANANDAKNANGKFTEGEWVMTDESGHTTKVIDADKMTRWISDSLHRDPLVSDYYNSLASANNILKSDRKLEYTPQGTPIEYEDHLRVVPTGTRDAQGHHLMTTKNTFDEYKQEIIDNATKLGKPIPSDKDIANDYDNENRKNQDIAHAVGLGVAARAMSERTDEYKRDATANPYTLKDYGEEKVKAGDIIGIGTPAVNLQKFDAGKATDNLKSFNQQIKTVESSLNQGIYNVNKANLDALKKKRDILQNNVKGVLRNYITTPDGAAAFDNIKRYAAANNIKIGDINDLADIEYHGMAGRSFYGLLTAAANGASDRTSSTPAIRVIEDEVSRFKDAASNYNSKNNTTSFTSTMLTGAGMEDHNKALTESIDKHRGNYIADDGAGNVIQLDQYLKDNLADGDKLNAAYTTDRFGDKYGHILTITDNTGKTKSTLAVYPDQGDEKLDKLGREIMEKNSKRRDNDEIAKYDMGTQMRATAAFPSINTEDIESKILSSGYTNQVNFNPNKKGVIGQTETFIPIPTAKGIENKKIIISKRRDEENAGDNKTGINDNYTIYTVKDGKIDQELTTARSISDLRYNLYQIINNSK